MKRIYLITLLTTLVLTGACAQNIHEQNAKKATELLPSIITIDTHNHIDVPMEKSQLPAPRVDLRSAMKRADMNGVCMTFAVDYVKLKYEGHAYERFPYAVPISFVYDDGKLYFHSALSGHKVDAIRHCDKASFCMIAQDDVIPEKYTTEFRSVIAFGRIHIIEDEEEKLAAARLLGNRYNPHQDEALQKEIESGLSRMLAIRFDIEHLTGKESIELTRRR